MYRRTDDRRTYVGGLVLNEDCLRAHRYAFHIFPASWKIEKKSAICCAHLLKKIAISYRQNSPAAGKGGNVPWFYADREEQHASLPGAHPRFLRVAPSFLKLQFPSFLFLSFLKIPRCSVSCSYATALADAAESHTPPTSPHPHRSPGSSTMMLSASLLTMVIATNMVGFGHDSNTNVPSNMHAGVYNQMLGRAVCGTRSQ